MRILNIRIRNLNSLEGEWFIDLEHPAYEMDGLFLITGPTGAGKTTILDAISLALYGKTPRLGDGRFNQEIISRYAGESLAEITFESKYGRYVATWSRRKSRGARDGNVQPQQRHLARIDGTGVGEKVGEVSREIVRLTGMDYEQFSRSVMLAQGQFASFLSGDKASKAALLARLTDTGIYAALSTLVHNITKDRKEQLTLVENSLAILGVLDKEELRALVLKKREMQVVLESKRKEIEDCNAALQWFENLRILDGRKRDIEKRMEAHLLEAQAFAPVLAELAGARKVEPVQAVHDGLVRSRNEAENLQQQIDATQQNVTRLGAIAEVLEKQKIAAKIALQECELALEQSRPLFMRIGMLDEKLKEMHKLVITQSAARKTAADACSQIERKLHLSENAKARLTAEQEKTGMWLAEHAGYEWLVGNLSALQVRHANLVEKRKKAAVLLNELKKLVQNLEQCDERIRELEKGRDTLVAEEKRRMSEIANWQSGIGKELAGKAVETLEEDFRKILAEKARAESLQSLEERRKMLQNGEPCPLCGALEHPYATGQLPDSDQWSQMAGELERRLERIKKLEKNCQAGALALSHQQLKIENNGAKIREQEQLKAACKERKAVIDAEYQEILQSGTEENAELCKIIEPFGYKECAQLDQPLQELGVKLEEWQRRKSLNEELLTRLNAMETQAARLKAEAANAAKELLMAERDLKAATDEMEALRAERMECFGDKIVDDEARKLKMRVTAAKEAGANLDKQSGENATSLSHQQGILDTTKKALSKLLPALHEEEGKFLGLLARHKLAEADFLLMRRSPEWMDATEQKKRSLDNRRTQLETEKELNGQALKEEEAKRKETATEEEIRAKSIKLQEEIKEIYEGIGQIAGKISGNRERMAQARKLREKLCLLQKEYMRWSALNNIIGSQAGAKFSTIAQNITLDILLGHANIQLAKIMDRYQFIRQGDDLELKVIDRHQANEIRPISNLSGGETFIASLALALGLSSMAGKNIFTGSMFLDEGFGSLDAEMLEQALAAIGTLHQEGRMIGIISHVDALREKIPTQIQVRPIALGRSEIIGPGCRRVA